MANFIPLITIMSYWIVITEGKDRTAEASMGGALSKADRAWAASKASNGAVSITMHKGPMHLSNAAAGIGRLGTAATEGGVSMSVASVSGVLAVRAATGSQTPQKTLRSSTSSVRLEGGPLREVTDFVRSGPGKLKESLSGAPLGSSPKSTVRPRRSEHYAGEKPACGTHVEREPANLDTATTTNQNVMKPKRAERLSKSHVAGGHLGVSMKSGPAAVSTVLAAMDKSDGSLIMGSTSGSAPGVSTSVSIGQIVGLGGRKTALNTAWNIKKPTTEEKTWRKHSE